MKTLIFCVFFGIYLCLPALSQSSYLKVLPGPQPLANWSFLGEDDSSGNLKMVLLDNIGFKVWQFSPAGEVVSGNQVVLPEEGIGWGLRDVAILGQEYLGSCYSLGYQDHFATVAVYANFEEENYWGVKTLTGVYPTGVNFISPGRMMLFHYLIGNSSSILNFELDSIGIAVLTSDAELEWSYFYRCDQISYMPPPVSARNLSAHSVSLLLKKAPGWQPFGTAFFFLKLDDAGNVLESKGMTADSIDVLEQAIDEESYAVYLSGRVPDPSFLDEPYGFISKRDSSYNEIWTRRLYAEGFPCMDLRMAVSADGGVLFAYITEGDLPIISGEIGSNGNLLWTRGYSFFDPKIVISSDGSIYFSSIKKYYEDGSWEPAWVLAKTTPEGLIESCPQFDACLELYDMQLPLNGYEWVRSSEGPPFEPVAVSVEPLSLSAEPHCGTPTPPTPYFTLPDTICAGDCLSPDSIYNRLAHQVEWYISGPGGLDTTIVDTTFNWCFEEAGVYQIEQGVWLLGCSDFYSRELVVLPDDLSPPLGQDTLICDEGPYVLQPQSSRPLREFLWADGSMGSILAVESSGLYTLEASDGYCSVRDTVQIDFIRELLEYAPIEPIGDTVLCPDLLPWEVRPQSAYSEAFILNGDSSTQASVFHLAEAGEYSISTEIEGCLLSETFALEVEPCEVDVYIPNAFSPNGDGLNDWVEPLGKAGKFTGIELSVHDRWGGVLYRTNTPPFRWDGRSASGDALNPGVYLLRFRYYNHRALREEEVVVEVNLVK